jgi:hypothetical protein
MLRFSVAALAQLGFVGRNDEALLSLKHLQLLDAREATARKISSFDPKHLEDIGVNPYAIKKNDLRLL